MVGASGHDSTSSSIPNTHTYIISHELVHNPPFLLQILKLLLYPSEYHLFSSQTSFFSQLTVWGQSLGARY